MNIFAKVIQRQDNKVVSQIDLVVMDVDSIVTAYDRIHQYFSSRSIRYNLVSLEDLGMTLVALKNTKENSSNIVSFKASIYELVIPKKSEEEEDSESKFVVVTDPDILRAAITEYNPTSVIMSTPEILVIANASRSFKFE